MGELDKKFQLYEKTFGDSFPTYPLMLTRTDSELIDIIDQCVIAKQDVYALGFLKDDDSIEY